MHIRQAIAGDPDVADEIHEALDHGEQFLIEFGTSPVLSSALAMLLGGGSEHIEDKGFPMQSLLATKIFTSYLARCERAGLNRIDRTDLPLELLGIDIDAFDRTGV
jgi:hypothetical protein